MPRLHVALVVGGIVFTEVLFATAQSSVPADIVPYRTWTKTNAAVLADPSNPRAGPKNTFTNLSPTNSARLSDRAVASASRTLTGRSMSARRSTRPGRLCKSSS